MQELLAQVDALFQRPALARAAWVEVVREQAEDRAAAARELAANFAWGLIGDEGTDNDNTYLRLSVRLLASDSQLLGHIHIDDKQVRYPQHLEVVRRCMWWCAPRRLPLMLAAKHGWLDQQFQAPAIQRIGTWDFRYPFGVATEQLSIQRQLPVLVQLGWRVEQAGLELRLLEELEPNALSRGVDQVLGKLNSLFGQQQTRPPERSFRTLEVGAWGFRMTTVRDGRVVRAHQVARADIGAITALGGRLLVFAAHGIEDLLGGDPEQLHAYALLLVSALVGVA